MEYVARFWESLLNFGWSFSLDYILRTFWYFFVFEFTRYYILDALVLVYRRLNRRARRIAETEAYIDLYKDNPLISIIVPGKGEGRHIYKLARSLKEQTYRHYELIIVDDGSTDDTPRICRDLEKRGFIDLFLRNDAGGGKASASNFGFRYAKGKYVVLLDADSSLDRDALEKIMLPFYVDPRIKAVGGCIKVRNQQESMATALQSIEYLETILVGRIVSSTLGIYRTISGAFGAFETRTLHSIGAWDVGPGLDGDITQKVRKAGWRIGFAPEAVCLTNVPTNFRALAKQRMRWSKSLVRFRMRKHIDVYLPNANFSFRNFFSHLENFVYDFFFDFLWIFYIISIIAGQNGMLLEVFVLKFLVMIPFSIFAFMMAMVTTERPRSEFSLIIYTPLMSLYSGFYIRIVRIVAHVRELFFFSSYKDPWNPKKISDIARVSDQNLD